MIGTIWVRHYIVIEVVIILITYSSKYTIRTKKNSVFLFCFVLYYLTSHYIFKTSS